MKAPTFYGLLDAARRFRMGNPGRKATFQVLVEHMGEHDGEWTCWPGVATLAEETEQGTRTVVRHLAEIEATGLIEKRREATTHSGGRVGIRTTFVLNVGLLLGTDQVANMACWSTDQVANGARPSGQSEPTKWPIGAAAPITGTTRTPNGKENALAADAADRPQPSFDEFWQVYPRKVGKGAARTAWAKAVAKAEPRVIANAAWRYANDPNRQPEFTPHPATWLNQERWEDEPLPARSAGPGQQGRMARSLTAAERAARMIDGGGDHERTGIGPGAAAPRRGLSR